MTPSEELKDIILKEKVDRAIPFLKELSKEDRKTLSKEIKDYDYLWSYNWKNVTQNGFSYRQTTTPKGTEKQKKVQAIASFVLQNQRDFEREWGKRNFLTKEVMEEILPWYVPKWFDKYVNNVDGNGWAFIPIEYNELLDLEEKGFCSLTPELVVNKILLSIRKSIPKTNLSTFTPEVLLKYPVTLDKHIWYLFEYESSVNWNDQYIKSSESDEGKGWKDVFQYLIDQNKIDRSRVMKESLLASNRNFNKNLSGWFMDLFDYLEPDKKDLLRLQQDLFSLFVSPHSKVINQALKYIKKIVNEPSFQREDFLDSSMILLNAETKSIVSSTLMIMDKIASKKKSLRTNICLNASQVFIQQDNDLQVRAAKLIAKHGGEDDSHIKEELEQYRTTLMQDAANLLHVYPDEEMENMMDTSLEEPQAEIKLDDLQPIEIEKDFDGFLFLASQAFDNNDPIHFDLFVASLVHLQKEIYGKNIAKLEPVFQRSYKTILGDGNSRLGFLDNMLATFFMDYGEYLYKKHPKDSVTIRDLAKAYHKKDKDQASLWKWYNLQLTPLKSWRTRDNTPVYYIFRDLLLYALEKIKQEDDTPLLSTPTHYPCWIDPEVLIERIVLYQAHNKPIDEMDLQISLARCFKSKPVTKEFITQRLSGEMERLLSFYLLPDTEPVGPFAYPFAWNVAAVTKNPEKTFDFQDNQSNTRLNNAYLTGQMEWEINAVPFKNQKYDYRKRQYIKFDDTRKELVVRRPQKFIKQKVKGWKRFFMKSANELDYQGMLYGNFQIKEQWLANIDNDIKRFLSLIPNNPGPLVAEVSGKVFRFSSAFSETDKRLITNFLEHISLIWNENVLILNDFLGMALMNSDKTAKSIAGEIWISLTSQGLINQERTGEAVAKMNHHDFAPLKRFVDMIPVLYTISPIHKIAMGTLLHSCLINLPDTPARNLKNLLLFFKETYGNLEDIKSDKILMSKLKSWESSTSLKKVIKSIVA